MEPLPDAKLRRTRISCTRARWWLLLGIIFVTGIASLQWQRSTRAPGKSIGLASPQDSLEIVVDLNATFSPPTKEFSHLHKKAKCVVSSNSWFIAGDFPQNARDEYWSLGEKIVKQRTITSGMYLRQAKDIVAENVLGEKSGMPSPRAGYPRVGEKLVTVRPAGDFLDGADGMARVVWLAFCSGGYFNESERQLPLPLGPTLRAWSDKTISFDDDLALPRHMEWHTKEGQLACQYDVLEVTNVGGRSFPLKFRLVQQRHAGFQIELTGKVTSIRIGEEPPLPEKIQKPENSDILPSPHLSRDP